MSISWFFSLFEGDEGTAHLQAAERHLTELRKHHPARVAEARVGSRSWRRKLRNRFARERERLSAKLEGWRRAWDAPHRGLGWLVARAKLARRPTVGAPTIGAVLAVALVAVVAFARPSFIGSGLSEGVRAAFFGATLTGAIVAIWGDLIRLPWHAWRIRRRILRNPWRVLPTTARKREEELMARDETSHIVPRRELYDELLPGILDRSRRDTQLVVGEPGAGKTTALVGVAELLARIGMVPVVVSLWGEMMPETIVGEAKARFIQHSRSHIHSEDRLNELWQWLRTHRRLVVLVDDLDRIAADGDRGFLLRRALEELDGEEIPAVVTTRPAGIPAGLAVSAISLDSLDEGAAVRHVLRVAREQPGVSHKSIDRPQVRGSVDLWIREGRLAEVPFYLELLARLVAAGRCEELAPAKALVDEGEAGKVRSRADGACEWNPLWVRYRLLERFHEGVAEGTVHRWLGIDARERRSCLDSLSEAALAQMRAVAMKARSSAGDGEGSPVREKIEDFLDADDRAGLRAGTRVRVSAHEVVSTAERLRMLDRDPGGGLHFSHRILQAFLAGRFLEAAFNESGGCAATNEEKDKWVADLLDPRHPERMTANMTLVFAALRSLELGRRLGGSDGEERAKGATRRILRSLVEKGESESRRDEALARVRERLDPEQAFDPEKGRFDPDYTLAKLTTAAEITAATGCIVDYSGEILRGVRDASGATRWTKLNAIPAIAGIADGGVGAQRNKARKGKEELHREQWTRIWEFARDPDHEVRRAASEAIADDAFHAYDALAEGVEAMIVRAALKSARDLPLDVVGDGAWMDEPQGRVAWDVLERYGLENEKHEIDALKALGWVLPAIVSGLREHPTGKIAHHDAQGGDGQGGPTGSASGPTREEYDSRLRGARRALDRLVTLAFQERFPELEAAVAQGFKNDAMRHANDPEERSGPGLVESNRQLVSDVCLDNARHWYARMVLHQALALYTVAGSDAQVAFGASERARGGGEPHPLASVAARQARRAVVRHQAGGGGWEAFVWADEGDAVGRRQPGLSPTAAQLVGDVTLLLNLRETASEDRQGRFARMSRLPYCLRESRDRLEILGAGCPEECAYGFCPLHEAPVDEPDGQRTITRAFCRGQQTLARRGVPPWQKRIRKRKLREFWREMERRART